MKSIYKEAGAHTLGKAIISMREQKYPFYLSENADFSSKISFGFRINCVRKDDILKLRTILSSSF